MPIDSTVRTRTSDEVEDPLVALHDSEQRLRCVLELASEYYWEQDEHFRFTQLRHRGSSALEAAPRSILGKTRWELDGSPVDPRGWERHKAVCRARRPFSDFVIRRLDEEGREQFLSISGKPVFDDRGRFKGYCGIARDITKLKRDERMLKLEAAVTRILADHEEIASALEAALQAICEFEGWDAGQYWSLDDAARVMRVHTSHCAADGPIRRAIAQARELEIRPGAGLVGQVWLKGRFLWCPDLSKESRIRRAALSEGRWSAVLLPVRWKGKIIGVLDFNGRRIPEPDERLLQLMRVLATGIGNLHQRAFAREQLRESEERYASTVELAAIGIGHVARDGRFIHVNQQLCDMLGYTREELLRLSVKEISHPDDTQAADDYRARMLAGEISSFSTEKRYLRKDGMPIWARITIALKRGSGGEHLYDISVVEDISERKRAEERVRYLATHDEMTGIPNRSMFRQLLERAVHSAARRGSLFALLFVDLDHFKIVNDTLGHEAGDLLLKETSARLKACLRASDTLARLGGDEFVVLMNPIAAPADAAGMAREILSAVTPAVEIMGRQCRVTASVGIATFPEAGRDPQSLMKKADTAMYSAKEDGKNGYRFCASPAGSASHAESPPAVVIG